MPFRERWAFAARIAFAVTSAWGLEACSLEPTPPRTIDCAREDRAAERYPDTCGATEAGSDGGSEAGSDAGDGGD